MVPAEIIPVKKPLGAQYLFYLGVYLRLWHMIIKSTNCRCTLGANCGIFGFLKKCFLAPQDPTLYQGS